MSKPISTPKIHVKINIAGTHKGSSDEIQYGDLYIDEVSGEVFWDFYIPC